MGTMREKANWQPVWWNEEKHGSAWERVKDALQRDWEQTKHDLGAGGRELDQDVNDTVKQVAGTDAIPPPNQANVPGGTPAVAKWSDVEAPMRYGHAAREHYNAQYPKWDDKLEGTLKSEWETKQRDDEPRGTWDQVKAAVRRGYERATS